jgi:hypothetical protein
VPLPKVASWNRLLGRDGAVDALWLLTAKSSWTSFSRDPDDLSKPRQPSYHEEKELVDRALARVDLYLLSDPVIRSQPVWEHLNDRIFPATFCMLFCVRTQKCRFFILQMKPGLRGRREVFSEFYQRFKCVCLWSLGERQANDAAGWQRIEYGACDVWTVVRPS